MKMNVNMNTQPLGTVQPSAAKTNDFSVSINGIALHVHYSDAAVDGVFLLFLRSMTALQKRLGRRILIMFAAPPGAGKSTLLSYLEFLSRDRTSGLMALLLRNV